MAVTFTGAGVATAASGASPQAITTTTAFAVGDLFVALMAYDNSGGGGGDPITGNIGISPATGAVGVSITAQTGLNDPGAASAGLCARTNVFQVTTAIPSGTSVSVAWSGTVVVRAIAFMKVSASVGTISYRTASGATGGNTVASGTATALVTPSVTNGEGVLCWAGHENGAAITGDADTTNGSWSAIYGTFQGTGATGMAAYFQSKVVTATATQSFSPTGTLSDWITGCLIFTEILPPAITQAAYRWYADGSESGATAYANQNTSYSHNVTVEVFFQLRVLLQSTTANAVLATDDFQLQYEKNTSGTWLNVTSASNNVRASTAVSNPADNSATTNRLTGGTGTFTAGKVDVVDGLVADLGWSGNNYTELLFCLVFRVADLAHNDVLRFRVLYNGATTVMTYTQTPMVTVITVVPATTAEHPTISATGFVVDEEMCSLLRNSDHARLTVYRGHFTADTESTTLTVTFANQNTGCAISAFVLGGAATIGGMDTDTGGSVTSLLLNPTFTNPYDVSGTICTVEKGNTEAPGGFGGTFGYLGNAREYATPTQSERSAISPNDNEATVTPGWSTATSAQAVAFEVTIASPVTEYQTTPIPNPSRITIVSQAAQRAAVM